MLGITVTIMGIGVLASRKRDSKQIVQAGDSELEKQRGEKIISAQEEIYEKHNKKRVDAQKDLENNSDEIDKILKEKYNLNKE